MQLDSQMVQYQQLKAQHDNALTRLQNLERERDTAICERMVSQLEAEGYQLDRAEEVAELVLKPADKREAHIKRIRDRYTRVPVGGPIPVQYQAEPPVGVPAEAAQLYQSAMDHLRQHPGMTLEQAYAAVSPNK